MFDHNRRLKKAKKKHLDKRLQTLLRRAKIIEDELLKLQSEDSFYRVSIFGSARIQPDSPQYNLVAAIAMKLAMAGIDILTGGGPGLMEAANLGAKRGVVEAAKLGLSDATIKLIPAKSFGISIELPFEPTPNLHLDIKRHHHKFSTRLDDFVRLSHSIIVTPGGIGTLLELFFCWQLIQVKHVATRPIILVDKDYWNGIIEWLKNFPLDRALISPSDFDCIKICDTVDEACEKIFEHHLAFRNKLKL